MEWDGELVWRQRGGGRKEEKNKWRGKNRGAEEFMMDVALQRRGSVGLHK